MQRNFQSTKRYPSGMRTSNRSESITYSVLILGFLAFVIGISVWWLPQKWQGCTKIYDNRPAQVFCFLQK